ncbi:MAG: MATE family efflux transporter [SAR202 cluster bacterium]|nr:MATE family efflux transporter [SAR202 cluster bacterium]
MQQILEGSIPVMLLRLSAPNVLAVTTMTAVTFADIYFIGKLGTTALASLAIVFPFQTLMGMMSNGAIGGGVASSIVRALGSGSKTEAENTAWHAFIIASVMAILYVLILGLGARPIFGLITDSNELLNGSVRYAHIVFGAAPIMWFTFMLAAILRGTGEMVIASNAVIVSGLIHIALSGALTLGWGPFPELGLIGPACAMVLSTGLAGIYLAFQVLNGKARLKLRSHKLQWHPITDVMKVGGLGLINSTGLVLTVIVVTALVGRYGEDALAGYGLGSRLELTLVPIAFGIGAALVTAVGGNIGARQFPRARKIAWTGAGATFVITSIAGIVIAMEPSIWINRFTTDSNVHSMGVSYLTIAAPIYGVFAGGQTLYFASQGTGNMIWPVVITYTRFLVVASVGFTAMIFDWGLNATFTGVAIGLAVLGVGQIINVLFTPAWNRDRT